MDGASCPAETPHPGPPHKGEGEGRSTTVKVNDGWYQLLSSEVARLSFGVRRTNETAVSPPEDRENSFRNENPLTY